MTAVFVRVGGGDGDGCGVCHVVAVQPLHLFEAECFFWKLRSGLEMADILLEHACHTQTLANTRTISLFLIRHVLFQILSWCQIEFVKFA